MSPRTCHARNEWGIPKAWWPPGLNRMLKPCSLFTIFDGNSFHIIWLMIWFHDLAERQDAACAYPYRSTFRSNLFHNLMRRTQNDSGH